MKILDLVGRALVRYFRRPATQASPQNGTELPPLSFPDRPTGPTSAASFDDLMAALRDFNVKDPEIKDRINTQAEVERRLAALDIPDDADEDTIARMAAEAVADIPGVRIGGAIRVSDKHKGLRGPDMGKTGFDPEDMSWRDWQDWMKAVNAPPGWSPCRFGARCGDETCGQMFGITRGDFGIYTKEFYVCAPVHGGQVLAAVIHLPTGTGVGVFLTAEHAVEAAELAMALGGIDWRTSIDPMNPDTWADIRTRMGQAWEAAGLHVAPFHAHDNGTESEIAIWMSTTATRQAGKPEKGKLS